MNVPSITASRDAVMYGRVSSNEQAKEGFSIPAQLRLLRAYAESSKITVAMSPIR